MIINVKTSMINQLFSHKIGIKINKAKDQEEDDMTGRLLYYDCIKQMGSQECLRAREVPLEKGTDNHEICNTQKKDISGKNYGNFLRIMKDKQW